ncbi:MAG: cytochrome P450 [Streptosporangiaceae bacterium]|nr:cytochrome P450 [Streptosporangiaceae bacterium]
MLADPAVYGAGVPWQEFARRRRAAAVTWVDEPALRRHSTAGGVRSHRGSGFWAVTQHAAIVSASRSPTVFSSAARGAFLADPETAEDLERARQLLVNMDAPEHGRIRHLVTAAFTPRAVHALSASIHDHAARLAGRALAAGGFDAVADIAAELPLLVLADLLGIPRSDRGLLLRWSNNLVGFDDPEYGAGSVDSYRETFGEAFRYARDLAARRRRSPGDDLISGLVAANGTGRRLTDQEFCQLWLLLVIAGNETTRHLLSGALLALAEQPDQVSMLVADPGRTPRAVDELLRWVTPIMQFRRTALADTELGGQRIRAGEKVVLYYISANRDETVFRAPDRLDLGRQPNPHLAFGVGPHYCLGSHLAHLETRIMLDAMRPYLADLRLAGPVTRLQSSFMNGIKSLPMTVVSR